MFIALYSKNMYAKMQILNNLFTCQFYMFFVLHVKFNGICSNETYFHFTAGTFSLMINNLNKRTFIFFNILAAFYATLLWHVHEDKESFLSATIDYLYQSMYTEQRY